MPVVFHFRAINPDTIRGAQAARFSPARQRVIRLPPLTYLLLLFSLRGYVFFSCFRIFPCSLRDRGTIFACRRTWISCRTDFWSQKRRFPFRKAPGAWRAHGRYRSPHLLCSGERIFRIKFPSLFCLSCLIFYVFFPCFCIFPRYIYITPMLQNSSFRYSIFKSPYF